MPAGHVGVVAVLEKCRATQLLAGDPFGNGNQTVLDLCLKAKPFECVLSLLGTEQQVKELEGESKARDLGEEHQLSISEGHSDAPFQSVIPQNFNSAEWAPLCRLSLSSPQRHLLQRECAAPPQAHPPAHRAGRALLQGPRHSQTPPRRDPATLVLMNAHPLLRGQGPRSYGDNRDSAAYPSPQHRGRGPGCVCKLFRVQGITRAGLSLTW